MAIKDTMSILKQLFAAYPNTQVSEQTVAVYLRALQDIPADELQVIVDQCIAQNKFVPVVSEIRDMRYQLKIGFNQPTAAEAWGQVRKQISSVGHMRQPEFDDPLVSKAVDIIGWKDICMSENLIADRARFLQIYQQLEQRGEQSEKLLPPSRQLAERNGYTKQLTKWAGMLSMDRNT